MKKHQYLKSSLISGAESLKNTLKENTIYSYLEHEEDFNTHDDSL